MIPLCPQARLRAVHAGGDGGEVPGRHEPTLQPEQEPPQEPPLPAHFPLTGFQHFQVMREILQAEIVLS